ncbi:MAG: hypothetical protein COA57_03645 [Flavobacteriales bacterium]|nr:MAG: hypothetical protein COA57_03645 [Flavobacteriales bacterium]
MSFRFIFLFVLVALLSSSCSLLKKSGNSDMETVMLDTLDVPLVPQPQVYRGTRKKVTDLLHTKLEISFDWEKQYGKGKATLTLKPYFYSTSELILDAKGFDLHKVALVQRDTMIDLNYEYDSLQIFIDLNKEYTRTDTFQVYIEYTAKPDELESHGSAAISDDRGLYFINPLGEEEDKPQQIWTQGETEANSCWFPTIDSPNEKMTQELYITVDTSFITLSNGKLVYQTINDDGTRTDYWKQELPHAPYLVMMTIGEFSIVKDSWKKDSSSTLDVHYYVESKYEPYAKKIFGNTPEMLTFFSEKLNYPYPWDKYHQIVVRDYVSGAMENTGAVIHGEFLQRTDRELLDATNEDVISHELFHHWFGDLVTCESWSNLPLNESFATYGEYLWREYKYGRDAADHHLQGDLSSYLQEAAYAQADMIRFDYYDKEDMFDSHSYAKGGRILHMLRQYTGDKAFFASLNLFLTKNAFRSVEIHDLRLAFEETTGEDLNWFFNQWFLASGHPTLLINYHYDTANSQQIVIIEQKQDFETTPLYELPITVDIYTDGKVEKHNITVTKGYEEFIFDTPRKPDLINVDAEKMLLCVKKDKKSREEWVFQYYKAPLYLDRYEAVRKCGTYARKDSAAAKVVLDALNDNYWKIRSLAMKNLKFVTERFEKETKEKLTSLAQNDKKAAVRATAIKSLNKYFDDESLVDIYKEGIEDPAYSVVGEALTALANTNPKEGMKIAKTMENEENSRILSTIAGIYAEHGSEEESDFFVRNIKELSGFGKINFLFAYEKYLKNETRKETTVNEGIETIEIIARSDAPFYIKLTGIRVLTGLQQEYNKRELELNAQIIDLEKQETLPDGNAGGSQQLSELQMKRDKVVLQKNKLDELLTDLSQDESNQHLLKYLGN